MACGRPAIGQEGYCSLHFGLHCKPNEDIPANPLFARDFASVIAAGDGNWSGFVFPAGVKFPNEVSFDVNARGSRLSAFELQDVKFKGAVDFSDAVFKSELKLRAVTFEGTVLFERCRFEGPVDFLHVRCESGASFYRSDFAGRTILRAHFSNSANFNETIFREGVNFSGWRNVTLGVSNSLMSISSTAALGSAHGDEKPSLTYRFQMAKKLASGWVSAKWSRIRNAVDSKITKINAHLNRIKRRFSKTQPGTQNFTMFEKEGHLESVVFLKPDQTVFSAVDLSRVYFRGTNLRGVRFLGVNWWQPVFSRNGLYDEIFIRLNSDGPFRHQYLPALEETCRNARVALEENRNFVAATDFYVAEMEAARAQLSLLQRHVFSVTALYHTVSRYGSSVGIAIRGLVLVYFFQLSLNLLVQLGIGGTPDSQIFSAAALRSLKVLLLQAPDAGFTVATGIQAWIDVVFRVIGPVQVAMVALAFRARIKRH